MAFDARKEIVQGDAVAYYFYVNELPTGCTLTKAWMTLKVRIADADPGALQKAITTSDVAGTGQIEQDGTDATEGLIRFDVTPTDSQGLTPGVDYYYDVQVKTTDPGGNMNIFTVQKGLFSVTQQVTVTNS